MNVYYKKATELLELLNNGGVTSEELVKYYFSRIKTLDKAVNAVVHSNEQEAIIKARKADEDRRNGVIYGPLHGLPCTVKDCFHVKGMLTTSGARHLVNNMASDNAPSISKLCEAGVIIMGKTNVPTLTIDWQTYNDVYGTTNNPWNTNLTPGGSSGGSAAAVAADFSPVEFGSDLCGCLRIPAHFTGIYSHRCSLGFLSVRGHVPGNEPDDPSELDLSSAGPMARCAADLRLMVSALYDPWVIPERTPDFNKSRMKDKSKIKIRAWLMEPGHDIDDVIAKKYKQFTETLSKDPRYEIDYGTPSGLPIDKIIELCSKLSGRLVGSNFNARQRMTAAIISLGYKLGNSVNIKNVDGMDSYYKGMEQKPKEQIETDRLRSEFNTRMSEFFEEYDVLLTPITPVLAFEHMHQPFLGRQLCVNGKSVKYNELVAWNALSTVLGLPSTVIPLNNEAKDLPCGIQIISSHFSDDITIDFAEMVEPMTGGFQIPNGY